MKYMTLFTFYYTSLLPLQ